MDDVVAATGQAIGLPGEVQHPHPAGQPAGKAHRVEGKRQIAVEVARHHGNIVALAQHAHEFDAVGLGAAEAVAEAVDQQ